MEASSSLNFIVPSRWQMTESSFASPFSTCRHSATLPAPPVFDRHQPAPRRSASAVRKSRWQCRTAKNQPLWNRLRRADNLQRTFRLSAIYAHHHLLRIKSVGRLRNNNFRAGCQHNRKNIKKLNLNKKKTSIMTSLLKFLYILRDSNPGPTD